MKAKHLMAAMLVVVLLSTGGCDLKNRISLGEKGEKTDLLHVEIVFTDGQKLTGYVKQLGLGKEGTAYTGSSSVSYIYDRNGNIVGSFNYNHCIYMKVLPE